MQYRHTKLARLGLKLRISLIELSAYNIGDALCKLLHKSRCHILCDKLLIGSETFIEYICKPYFFAVIIYIRYLVAGYKAPKRSKIFFSKLHVPPLI